MNLLALGLNHETAPLELRERAAFAREALPPALRELVADGGAREAAILSTCNRTEIYCGRHAGERPLLDWLCRRTGISREALGGSIYRFPDDQAVKHAFRVASGLDSMVLGEPQILGQMKDAFHAAADAGATGKVLNRLFQRTFSVAKQVRTDTAIGANPVSLAYAGAALAAQVFARLNEQRALLIGAGETVELVARHLRERGVTQMVVANRSLARAQNLARALGGGAIGAPLAQMPEHLARADIVVSATASTLPILGKGAVERALAARRHKPMCILDLAVPRDVEPQAGKLRDVYLYCVDDLRRVVDSGRDSRMRAAREAEMIIDLQVVRFMRWMRSLESVPAIRELRGEIFDAARAEAGGALRRMESGEDPREAVEQLARRLAKKFAHHPSEALRRAQADGDSGLLAAARKLFNLKS
ncbi:MAG: glutamyl-tRNA reductase [Gammaproteobacteria bacterium]|nr:glutamyl-tRNA reductase [Gammaproteobacteria bacterium]CAJ2376203.1 MAG: glutamyl-tRNA reductase [Arenicellales bacterium IbO2]MDA7961482.1 glutamyl-tRNA reductase [Gammaproteobacteria bacterium]MDA7969180.1 glutamyl-tRNA reductase [Gammaproteobacteria bacterium]MDA7971369.1 glutamyl-tRNA reductase [Gammaproteobacteria bacterium]